MNIIKKIFSCSLLLIIITTLTIPVNADSTKRDKSHEYETKIEVDGYTYRIKVDCGYDLEFSIKGIDGTFDKAELAARVYYDDDNKDYHLGNNIFEDSRGCIYDDNDQYRQINGVFEINSLKIWCRITKNNKKQIFETTLKL